MGGEDPQGMGMVRKFSLPTENKDGNGGNFGSVGQGVGNYSVPLPSPIAIPFPVRGQEPKTQTKRILQVKHFINN